MTGTGESMGDKVRKGVGLVHGTGEAIRGNFNATVDSAAGDRSSAARHQTVAERGLDEMQHGHYHGTGAGVTPVDTERERQNRTLQGESKYTGSTNHGPHATNVGNKADPRVDSDLDNRGVSTGLGSSTTGTTGTTGTAGLGSGTTHGSTNYGPHSSNIGNKADPRVDSDLSHHGTGTGYNSTGTEPHSSNLSSKLAGTQGSNTAVPPTSNFASSLEHGGTTGVHHRGTVNDSTNHGPHTSNLANKVDPRIDSDRDHRAAGVSTSTGTGLSHGAGQGNVDSLVEAGENHRGTGVGTGTGTGVTQGIGTGKTQEYGKVDSLVDAGMDHRGTGTGTGTTHSSTNYGPHDTNFGNKADPRVDSDLDHRVVGHGTTNVGHTTNPRVGTTDHHGTGTATHSTNHGPHDSDVANKADPRVDSDMDHRETTHASTNQAHSSKIANVLDPRVDSKTGTWK